MNRVIVVNVEICDYAPRLAFNRDWNNFRPRRAVNPPLFSAIAGNTHSGFIDSFTIVKYLRYVAILIAAKKSKLKIENLHDDWNKKSEINSHFLHTLAISRRHNRDATSVYISMLTTESRSVRKKILVGFRARRRSMNLRRSLERWETIVLEKTKKQRELRENNMNCATKEKWSRNWRKGKKRNLLIQKILIYLNARFIFIFIFRSMKRYKSLK